MAKKRLKKHKQQAMQRRLITGKKPMTPEQKEVRKNLKKAQSATAKASKSK